MEDLFSESNFCMTEMWPPVPPVTREALTAEPGAGGGGGAGGNPPTSSVSPRRSNVGVLTVAVAAAAAMTAAPAMTAATATTAGTFPRLVGRPARNMKVFGELTALQSGRMRSQSWSLTMSRFCADALLT